jgi:hypothetical protein
MENQLNVKMMLLFGKKYAYENIKPAMLVLFAIASFFILLLGVYLLFTNPWLFAEGSQSFSYFMGLFLFGCFTGGVLFSELGSKSKAINFLMTPVSIFTKFCCGLFFGVILFIIGYTVVFLLVDSVVIQLANIKNGTHFSVINPLTINLYPNRLYDGPWSLMFYVYFVAQSYFILVSVWTPKYSLVRSIVGLGILWVILILILLTITTSLPKGMFSDSFRDYQVMDSKGQDKIIELPVFLSAVFVMFFEYALAPLLWISAYLKLKEKQL